MRQELNEGAELKKIARLAREYSAKGFEVYTELTNYPESYSIEGIRPDIIAKKGDQTIIIEVKTKNSKKANKDKIEQLARFAQNHPNVRFDLVLTNPLPSPERFNRRLKSLADELIRAHSYYYIWEQLWPSKSYVRVLSQYRVFFHYTRAAHLQMFLISITKMTKSSGSSIAFWSILDEIENNSDLVPQMSDIEMKELRNKLESNIDLFKRVQTYCNRKISNIGIRDSWPDKHIGQDTVITIGEAKTLLTTLTAIFNAISVAHEGRSWHMETIGLRDTTSLLEILSNQLPPLEAP